MRQLFILTLLVITISAYGQKDNEVKLNWKIGSKETLTYQTLMDEIDTSEVKFNFNGLSKDFSDSSLEKTSDAQNILKKLNDSFKNIDLLSTLTNKGNGIIDVEVKFGPKKENKKSERDKSEEDEDKMRKMAMSMNQGVVLRGSVYETGGIHSFWVKSSQRNLIALFFQLPTKPVKIGDAWELDIQLISNDQNFNCDSSFKFNRVILADLKKVKGETIAVIKYEITEYVHGTFNSPFSKGKGDQGETMMKFIYQGVSEFSVDKGRWLTYDGIMSLEASGVMTANMKKKFSLIKQ
jgi:hypothetical protein